MPTLKITLPQVVESLSIQELDQLKFLITERLTQLRAIRLDDTEKKMLHGPVGEIKREAQLVAIAHLKARTGLELIDAKLLVEAFCNGSFRG